MGKASSSKKVARAARTAARPGVKKSYAWPMAIAGVVVVGVVLVILSFTGGADSTPPLVGDHWHAAYGIYDCDHFLTPLTDKAGDTTGIHTHGDGLMHIHPFTSQTSGKGANIEAFGNDTGMKVTDTSIQAPSIGLDVKNGDKCGDKPGQVKLFVWQSPTAKVPTILTTDVAKFAPQNGNVWALAFVPKDTAIISMPESAANLADPLAAEEGRQPAVGGATTTTAPQSTTTAAP